MRLKRDYKDFVGPNGNLLWIGALSFELRCLGSIMDLQRANVSIRRAIVFDYPTKLVRRDRGEQSRAFNRSRMQEMLGDALTFTRTHPYRYAELVGAIDRIVAGAATDCTACVIDVTCLTKIHALAVVYWLCQWQSALPVYLAYSTPERYGEPSRNIWGRGKWLHTLLVRLDLDAIEDYSTSWAVAIVGHEGDRMRLALHEAEATDGLVIKAEPIRRSSPELAKVTDIQNAWLYREINNGIRQKFRAINVRLDDLATVSSYVHEFAHKAYERNARIVLCPFGPKPFLIAAGMSALSAHSGGTWLSYPVPAAYDAAYSSGYRRTYWFDPLLLASSWASRQLDLPDVDERKPSGGLTNR